MDGDQKQLEILIKIVSDLIGKDKADEYLASLRDQGKLTENQTLGLTDATKRYIAKLQEQGEESLSAREKMHSLHAVLHSLGPEFSEVAHLARLFFNPMTAAAAAAAFSINYLREQFAHVLEHMRAISELHILELFGADESGEAADFSKWNELANSLERIATAQQTIAQKTADNISRLNEEYQAHEKIVKLKEAQNESDLKLLAIQQGWSAEKLANAMGFLKGKSQEQFDQGEIEVKKKELDARKQELEQSEKASTLAVIHAAHLEMQASHARALADANKGEIDSTEELIKKRQEMDKGLHGEEKSQNEEVIRGLIFLDESLKQKQPVLEAAAKKAEEDYNESKKKTEDLEKSIKDLPLAIEKLSKTVELMEKTAAESAGIRSATNLTDQRARDFQAIFGNADSSQRPGIAQDVLQQGFAALDAQAHLKRGAHLTDQQRQQIERLRELFTALELNGDSITEFLRQSIGAHKDQASELKLLKDEMKVIANQLKNFRNRQSS
jgi:hypothetical protein